MKDILQEIDRSLQILGALEEYRKKNRG